MLNIVNGYVPIRKSFVQGYEKSFRKLLSRQTSLKEKRQLFARETDLVKTWFRLLSLFDKIVMHTEEFILIPKRMFASHQPVKKEVLDNPLYKQKAAQLSLLQRNQSNSMEKPEKAFEPVETADKMIETAEEEKTEPMSEDSEIAPVVKNKEKAKISTPYC